MKCPKCPGRIVESETKSGAPYGSCLFCKGTWTTRANLPLIFKTKKVTEFVTGGLHGKAPTVFKCSYCNSALLTGKVGDSGLKIDECPKCEAIYFDRGEMDDLLRLVGRASLPIAEGVKFESSKLIETKEKCPCCRTETLWAYQGKEDRFKTCRACNGILTSVEVLQKIAQNSLFGPTMFTFRACSGVIKKCRFCHEEQNAANAACQKCGREIGRAQCFNCSSNMSEYQLHDCNIERCQICNAVWLDPGELEQMMTLMPDVRKSYEAGQRKLELDGAVASAVAVTAGMMIEASKRKFLDNSPLGKRLGPLIFFFY